MATTFPVAKDLADVLLNLGVTEQEASVEDF
jgi:hypothetical protein